MIGRRRLLRRIGETTIIGLLAGNAAADGSEERPVATGAVDNDDEQPVYAKGRMVHRYEERKDGRYQYQKVFRSPTIEKRYGKRQMVYEPELVPPEVVPEEVVAGEASSVTTKERRIIGTTAEHATAEERIRSQNAARLASPTVSNTPLYHYASESDATNPSLSDRVAPINLVWQQNDAQSVRTSMENGFGSGDAWDNTTPFETKRWINNFGDPIQNQTEVEKDDGSGCGFPFPDNYSQYHIRLYTTDSPDSDITGAGQAHRDPCDHNQIPLSNQPWEFDDARAEALTFWDLLGFDTETVYLGNTHPDWDTHDGSVGYVSS